MSKGVDVSKMLTVAKMAKKLGASPGQVRKAVKAAKIEPAAVKAGCSYYEPSVLDRVRKALPK